MRKTKIALLSLLAAVVAVCSVMFFAACGDKEDEKTETETVAIEWVLPDGVSVSVEGATEKPATWTKGQDLVFTLTVPNGYSPVVKAPTTISPKDGKYTVSRVSRDTTVTVTLDEQVTAVTVEKAADAEFVYFAGDALDTSTITVKATYAVTGEKVIETGYTVNPSLFVIGDTSFTVTFKGVTSAAVELDKEVEGREFGFTKVSLELGEDDTPYYVLQGSYSNYDVDNFGEIGFDFQEQGFYSEAQGGSAGWTYVLYNTEMTEFANGVFTLKVDMSKLVENLDAKGLTTMLFNPHMGFNTPGDDANPNVSVDNYTEGESIITGGIEYKLHKTSNDEADTTITTWGMVGVIITNVSAPTYKNSHASLEKDGDKVYFVINGTSSNYEKDALLKKLTENIVADYSFNAAVTGNTNSSGDHTLYFASEENEQTIFVEIADDLTYKVKLDISDAEEGIMFFHFSFNGLADDGTMSGLNLKCALSTDEADLTVTAGDLTYTLVLTESSESWATGLTGVKIETAA